MKAKIMHGFMVVVLLFMQLMNLGGIQTAAATTPDQIEKVITTSNALDVNVTGTVQGDQINWALSYNKKDQGELRALKVRVSTDRDATLRLAPKANQLVQAMQGQDSQPKNQWWIEKAYSRSSQNVLYYSTPKTNNRLYVAVELNRREVAQTAQSTTTTVEAADAEADPDPLQTPVDSALTDTLVGPVEVLLPLSTATEEEQAVAIDRPAANTPQTEADAANTVDAVEEKVQATQGLLNANVYAKEYDRSQSFSLEDYRMPLDYTPVGTADGVYPTKAWAFKDNTNVKNHIGGNSQENKLYSNTGVVDAVNNTWLDYGANKSNPEFRIRKYAKETSTKGLFDVQLDIKGNTVDNSKPMAVVLVLDYSGSMGGDNKDRIEALRTGVTNFLADIRKAGLAELVSVGVVGFSKDADGLFSIKIDTVAENETKIINKLSTVPTGGTFTQAGLTLGADMLKTSDIADKKMIVLTDGVPTFAYKITQVANLNDADKTLIGTRFQTTGTGSIRGSGSSPILSDRNTNTTGKYSVGSTEINDTWSATTGQAHLIKQSGVNLHVLGIEIKDATGSDRKNTLNQMTKWASIGSDNKPLFHEALNADDVEAYLDAHAKAVIDSYSTVLDGTITDPIGAQFSFNTNANGQVIQPTVTLENSTIQPVATISGRTVNVSKLTLGKNQTATIKYQVRINTEEEGFKADYWYPMNGTTTFTAKEGTPTVEFGVPSAKAPSKIYTVKKVWEDIPDAGVKPEQLTVQVAREGSTFKNDQILTLVPNGWTATFKDVAYGNQGQALKYQVTGEIGADASYVSTQKYDTNTLTLTLTNVQYGVQVKKESTDLNYLMSTDAAKTAQFTLNTYKNQDFTDPSGTGLVAGVPQGLAEGFYGIKETVAPEGFKLDPTEYLFRRDSAGKWFYYGFRKEGSNISIPREIAGTMNLNQVDGKYDRFELENGTLLKLVKYNEPKRNLKLVLVKKGFMDSFLPGAKFTLTGPETETLTSVATEAGVTAETKLFGNDDYTLTEIEAPGGYEKLDATVSIKVNARGDGATVKVDGQTLTSNGAAVEGYSYKLVDGKLIITAVNQLAVQEMPVTGGPGLNAFIASALVLMVGATAAGLTLRYKKEQEGR
ncbi:SpaA isopeptide-forming pilin-related protein [Lacticaseibacillus suibinensis]|uniref:SpaA isopeptide-forming pilin-related protein n=1 Tax=Lacticaseibacillus suibinensis TaxID=2486011 RepID=UPI00194348A4|nr:SpaA isopeptide-forming pilin-related protein [Lacticaseibacillus suibinensis]